MAQDHNSVPYVLRALYEYDVRLRAELDRLATTEGLAEVRDPTLAVLDRDLRVRTAQAYLDVGERLFEAGKPVEFSESWQHAISWLADYLPDLTPQRLTECLVHYCTLRLAEKAGADEKPWRVAVAEGGIRGRALLGKIALGRASRQLVKERLHELGKQRRSDPAYRQLAGKIKELDDAGKGDDLLREVWERYPEEASDALLQRPGDGKASTPGSAQDLAASVDPPWAGNC